MRLTIVMFCLALNLSLNVAKASTEAFPRELTKKSFQIMIDPGHGGNDSGATQGQTKESDVVLKVGQILKKIIDENPRFAAHMTRQSDRFLNLQDRVRLAEEKKVDLFVSIHANSSIDQRARGVELYFQNHLPADEDSLYLASIENKQINNEKQKVDEDSTEEENPSKKSDIHAIIEDLKRQDRMLNSYQLSKNLAKEFHKSSNTQNASSRSETLGIRQAPFYVVSQTGMPSVLIELGFLTNPKEASKLTNPDHQKEIAQKIYKGLLSYMEVKENNLHLKLFPKNQ